MLFFCYGSYDIWRHLATAKCTILRKCIAEYYLLLRILREFYSCCDCVASPQATALCADEAGFILSVLLLICLVFFSCFGSVAWPQVAVRALAWAPRSRACDRNYAQRLHRVESTSPRVLPCLYAHEAGNIYSASLLICRLFFS
jgi:hypothetical protein